MKRLSGLRLASTSFVICLTLSLSAAGIDRASAGGHPSTRTVLQVANVTANPVEGDTSSPTDTPPTGTDAAGVRAYLELALSCMKQRGTVPASTNSSQVLGSMSESGVWTPPTATEVVPSEGCVNAAVDQVEVTSEPASVEEDLKTRLVDARAKAISGRDIHTTKTPLQASRTGGFAVINVVPDPDPSLFTKRYWINVRGQRNSMGGFLANRYSPGFLNWSADGCSAPLKNRSTKYNFSAPCVRHDFSYRNLRGASWWGYANKSRADAKFGQDMRERCNAFRLVTKAKCRVMAWVYETGVRVGALPTTVGSPFYGDFR